MMNCNEMNLFNEVLLLKNNQEKSEININENSTNISLLSKDLVKIHSKLKDLEMQGAKTPTGLIALKVMVLSSETRIMLLSTTYSVKRQQNASMNFSEVPLMTIMYYFSHISEQEFIKQLQMHSI